MAKLHIALQDGFAGGPVAIRVAGREVYRKTGVRTDLRISRADAIDVEAPDAETIVEVEADGRAARTTVAPGRTPYVAINLDERGEPQLRPSTEPFAYL